MPVKYEKPITDVMAESFKVLAAKKPIEKITIKEITDLSGIIRPTFYNHFQDKYQLLEYIIKKDLIEPAKGLFSTGDGKGGVTKFYETIFSNKDFYQSCAKLEGQNSFSDILRECIAEVFLGYSDKNALKELSWINKLTPRHVALLLAENVTFATIFWIKSDFDIPIEEVVNLVRYLTSHSIMDIVKGKA